MAEAGRCGIRSSERAREKAWSESASTEELSQPKKNPRRNTKTSEEAAKLLSTRKLAVRQKMRLRMREER